MGLFVGVTRVWRWLIIRKICCRLRSSIRFLGRFLRRRDGKFCRGFRRDIFAAVRFPFVHMATDCGFKLGNPFFQGPNRAGRRRRRRCERGIIGRHRLDLGFRFWVRLCLCFWLWRVLLFFDPESWCQQQFFIRDVGLVIVG